MAVAAAEREYRQIQSWMLQRDSHPFGDNAEKVAIQLRGMVSKVRITLNEINDDIRLGRVEEAWERCAELQRDQLPGLANELLAVIGGLYLTTNNLDDMRPLDGNGQPIHSSRPLSFSGVARSLLDDLSLRANNQRGSLLIVSEERQVPFGAEIVRLRFPACDLWDLPFTAHEYGYLVGQRQPPEDFARLRSQIEHAVDPKTHHGHEPADADCYLPEVRQLWESYGYRHPEEDGEPPGPEEEGSRELQELKGRQVAHLCRLFADSFATYFVGPAYVHALLRLRFRPDRTLIEPIRTVPAFTERFVFAFETLRLMDEAKDLYMDLDFDSYKTPFYREVNETTGLLNDWRVAVTDARTADTYAEVRDRFQPWIDTIWKSLKNPAWREMNGRPAVYRYWQQALKAEQALTQVDLSLETRPHQWAVVNAAWSARTQGDDSDAQLIETNALRLLDLQDTDVISQRTGQQKPSEKDPRQSARTPESAERAHRGPDDKVGGRAGTSASLLGQSRDYQAERVLLDVKTVQNALRDNDQLLIKFVQDADEGGTLTLRANILAELGASASAEALDAYKRLCGLFDTRGGP